MQEHNETQVFTIEEVEDIIKNRKNLIYMFKLNGDSKKDITCHQTRCALCAFCVKFYAEPKSWWKWAIWVVSRKSREFQKSIHDLYGKRLKVNQTSPFISLQFILQERGSQTGSICLMQAYQIFAVLLPDYYNKMLNHIAMRKHNSTFEDEKIQMNVNLLNELTSTKQFSFDRKIIQEPLTIVISAD